MSCSSSSASRRPAAYRLAAALAASLALHAPLAGLRAGAGAAWTGSALSASLAAEATAQERAAPAPTAARQASSSRQYYKRRELDVPPGIMTRVEPEYPDLARVSGKVLLRLFIDEHGTVEHVDIVRAEPRGVFEASARRAFLAARFTPGMKAGRPVKSQLTLQVDYTYR